jgi:hypothetical protein
MTYDIDTAQTKSGTPLIFVWSRIAFLIYFLFIFSAALTKKFPHANIHVAWLVYLVVIYIAAEYLYEIFKKRGIDLTFAWPLLFSVYCFHLVLTLSGGRDRLPPLNLAEHFASFVLICYIVWIFFLKYLPQKVWRNHPYYTALLVLSVTSTLGVANELVELLYDFLLNTSLVGGKYDTSLDLLMNTLGAGTFLGVRIIVGSINQNA